MNKQWKAKWLTALRNGEYKQSIGTLKAEGYCCLGVLCDLAVKEKIAVWDGLNNIHADGSRSSFSIPISLMKVFDEENRAADWLVESCFLSEYNDKGFSFEQIADLIEKYL